MDIVPLKQLMKYFVNHLHPPNTGHDIPRQVRNGPGLHLRRTSSRRYALDCRQTRTMHLQALVRVEL